MAVVSVLMPVYNASGYLAEAIESVVSQTFTDWEFIIVDDGSTDGSDTIIKKYAKEDKKIKYYRNEQNLGVIKTLNRGISLCSGKYIARMDADDICVSERLEMQYNFLEKNTGVALCGTYAMIINEEGRPTGKIINLQSDEYLQISLLFTPSFVHPSIMVKAEVLKANLYSDAYKHAEDYELWCRIARNHQVANIPCFLLKYRWHTQNVSVVNNFTQEDTKRKIIRGELQRLALNPDKEELKLHTISYRQYDAKNKSGKEAFTDYYKLENWFSKIINSNKIAGIYSPNALSAHLWSRWIVLCLAQKNYKRLLSKPGFISFKPNVFIRLIRLVYFYSRK